MLVMTKVYLCYSLLTPKYLQPIANPKQTNYESKGTQDKVNAEM